MGTIQMRYYSTITSPIFTLSSQQQLDSVFGSEPLLDIMGSHAS